MFVPILVYSKYSRVCSRLLNIVKFQKIDLLLFCVDNETIRDRVIRSNRVKIDKIPCILVSYDDGNVEKFEGDMAFHWVKRYSTPSAVTPLRQQATTMVSSPEEEVSLEGRENFETNNNTSLPQPYQLNEQESKGIIGDVSGGVPAGLSEGEISGVPSDVARAVKMTPADLLSRAQDFAKERERDDTETMRGKKLPPSMMGR